MRIIVHEMEMVLERLQHEIKLMSQERVLSQIIGDHIAWFRHYQPVDIRMLEAILGQADKQYKHLPDNEKRWLDNLKEFYDDFKSFDWGKYRSLPTQEKKKYQLETAFSWAEKLRPLVVISEDFDDPIHFLQIILTTEQHKRSKSGIIIPKILIDGTDNPAIYKH